MGNSKKSKHPSGFSKEAPEDPKSVQKLNPQLIPLTKKKAEALVTSINKKLLQEEQEKHDSKHGKK